MSRFQTLIDRSFDATFLPDDYISTFAEAEKNRKVLIYRMQRDLHDVALDLGQTTAQADEKIDDLFGTFGGDWSIYILTGTLEITNSIENDATLAWLDTEYPVSSGVTIRTRLINRLNNG